MLRNCFPKYNDWTTRSWGSNGTGTSDDGTGNLCGVQSGGMVTAYTMPDQYKWPGEYCNVEAYRNIWDGTNTRIDDRIRQVQTMYELRTGGKAKYKGSDRLIILTAAGFAIRNPFWRQKDPDSTHNGYVIPKGQIEVGSFGPCLEPDGKLYVALPPHQTYDVTPRSKGIKFIDWTMPTGVAYDMVVANFATIPEDRERTTVGVGEASTIDFEPTLPIGAQWSVKAGGGSATPATPYTSTYTVFTAASNAVETLVVAFFPAPPGVPIEKWPRVKKDFKVIEPEGIKTSVRLSDPYTSLPVVGAGFQSNVSGVPSAS